MAEIADFIRLLLGALEGVFGLLLPYLTVRFVGWLDLTLILTGLVLFTFYKSHPRPRDFLSGAVTTAILVVGLALVGVGLLLNQWTVANLFSKEGVLSTQTKIIVWSFDIVMILVGAGLILNRANPTWVAILTGKSHPALFGLLVGIFLVVLLLFNVRAFVFLPSNIYLDKAADPRYTEIDPVLYQTNVAELIQIEDEADILAKRAALIQYIWGDEGFPAESLPGVIEEAIEDDRYSDLNNLARINRVTVNMEWGVNSVSYHFVPVEGRNELVVYHQGHGGDFILGKAVIQRLLNEGYAVIGLSMPLLGLNNQPVVYSDRFGRLQLQSHNQLRLLQLDQGHPIKFFVHPVAVALNYAQGFDYEAVHMIGLSGGGWTTTLYAALDPRILRSYPVAGSQPIYIAGGNGTEYETTVPELYFIANYLELYILGSYGKGRQQLQILNQFDSCCFHGVAYQTYEEPVKDKMRQLGRGSFAVYLDSSHVGHIISNQALRVIVEDLAD